MKLLRTIRLDPSDTFVFPRAAEPGEWAVTGSFLFGGPAPSARAAQGTAAFRSGCLGSRPRCTQYRRSCRSVIAARCGSRSRNRYFLHSRSSNCYFPRGGKRCFGSQRLLNLCFIRL